MRRGLRRWLVAVLPLVVVLLSAPAASTATLTAGRSLGTNVFATGSWYFLHNNPTPPTGNTSAVNNLSMTATAPTQTTLYNYDTNADSVAGRRIQKSGSGAGDATLAHYANWRSAAFASARTIAGSVVLRISSGISGFTLNTQGVLVAYLRDFNPTNSKYVEIANATLTDANWQAGSITWVEKRISIPVGSYAVASGHVLEVKVETTAASSSDMLIAYDATGYPSALSLP
jgi:hypothetical protein